MVVQLEPSLRYTAWGSQASLCVGPLDSLRALGAHPLGHTPSPWALGPIALYILSGVSYGSGPFCSDMALSILHKVLKREGSGYHVRKPSAFIADSVKKAWHEIG